MNTSLLRLSEQNTSNQQRTTLQETDHVLTQPVVSHVPTSTPGPVKPLLPIPANAMEGMSDQSTTAH